MMTELVINLQFATSQLKLHDVHYDRYNKMHVAKSN